LLIMLILLPTLIGFLNYNIADGRIFLGDAGSHGLAMLFAGMVLLGANDSQTGMASLPVVLIPMMFMPFLLDATVTLLKRLAKGEPVHQGHRQHLYQRMHQRGMTHLQVSQIYAGLTFCSGITAWLTILAPASLQWLGPFMLICFLGAAFLWAEDKLGAEQISGQSND